MKIMSFLGLMSIIFITSGFSATWKVDLYGNGQFSSISEALTAEQVRSGDTVIVAPGRYVEQVWIPVEKDIILRSSAGPESTIIVAPFLMPFDQQQIVHVPNASIFEGFSVLGNQLEQSESDIEPLSPLSEDISILARRKMGIEITGPGIIRNTIVKGNYYGILTYCSSGAAGQPARVIGNRVSHNLIGIACCETLSIVDSNLIASNYSVGIECFHSSVSRVLNNLIINNGSIHDPTSAGIRVIQDYINPRAPVCMPEISSNTIDRNRGHGILCLLINGAGNMPVINHNIITRNAGYGIFADIDVEKGTARSLPIAQFNDIWLNRMGGEQLSGIIRTAGNISADPQFTYNYRLKPDSPCLDAGYRDLDRIGATLFTGEMDTGLLDIGCHFNDDVSWMHP